MSEAPRDCREFQGQVSEYIDGELPLDQAARLETHSQSCPVCGPLLRTLRMTLRLCANETAVPLPDAVQQRIHARLAAAMGEPPVDQPVPPARRPETARAPARRRGWAMPRPAWALAVVLLAIALGLVRWRAGAETTTGWLMDQHCLSAFRSHPGDNPRDCLIKCAKYGYGVLDARGDFHVFDSKGNRSAQAALAASRQPDHLWVKVRGRTSGSTLNVEELTLEPPDATATEPGVVFLPLLH